MKTIVVPHCSTDRLLKPANNRADQDRGTNGRTIAGKQVRQRDGRYATNAPRAWPAIHETIVPGTSRDDMIDAFVSAMDDAIACPEEVVATNVARVGPRGILTIDVLLRDGDREVPVFLYEDASTFTARRFTNARDICAMLGLDDAVYYAPLRLSNAIGAGAEEPLTFEHFQPTDSGDDVERAAIWGEGEDRRGLTRAWKAFDKAVARNAADFAATLFERGSAGRLRGLRLPGSSVGTWLLAPDQIIVSATASRNAGIRLEFPVTTAPSVGLTIIEGLTRMAEEFDPTARWSEVRRRPSLAPPPIASRPQLASAQEKPAAPVAAEAVALAPCKPLAFPVPKKTAPAEPTPTAIPARRPPVVRPLRSTAIARSQRVDDGRIGRIGGSNSAATPGVRPIADAPRTQRTSAGLARAQSDMPVPNAAPLTAPAVEALCPEPVPDRPNARRVAAPARFDENGYFIPAGADSIPTPGEFTLNPEDMQFLRA